MPTLDSFLMSRNEHIIWNGFLHQPYICFQIIQKEMFFILIFKSKVSTHSCNHGSLDLCHIKLVNMSNLRSFITQILLLQIEWIKVFYVRKIIVYDKKKFKNLISNFCDIFCYPTNSILSLGWHNFSFEAFIEIRIIILEK